MIKLIVNGYYRSGSTLLFKMLELANPKTLVLYEPLHPEIFFSFMRFGPNYIEPLHNYTIYRCYFKLSKFKLIKQLHYKIGFNYFDWNKYTTSFFDAIHNINKPTILQLNRGHFILYNMYQRYKCRFIHVIRNPLDEWLSFISPTIMNKKIELTICGIRLPSLLKTIFKVHELPYIWKMIKRKIQLRKTGPFYLDLEFELIKNKFKLKLTPRDRFDKFILLWTIINKSAIAQVNRTRYGMYVWYENIVLKKNELNKLEKFSNFKFKTKEIQVYNKSIFKFDMELLKEFWERCERLGIKNDVRSILKTSKNENLLSITEI